MVTSLWNVLDFLAFFPPLLELCLFHGANVTFTLGGLDLRWFKILRWVTPDLGASTGSCSLGRCMGGV